MQPLDRNPRKEPSPRYKHGPIFHVGRCSSRSLFFTSGLVSPHHTTFAGIECLHNIGLVIRASPSLGGMPLGAAASSLRLSRLTLRRGGPSPGCLRGGNSRLRRHLRQGLEARKRRLLRGTRRAKGKPRSRGRRRGLAPFVHAPFFGHFFPRGFFSILVSVPVQSSFGFYGDGLRASDKCFTCK